MRTTIALSDDVFFAAKRLAAQSHQSLGDAVSHLMRLGLQVKDQAISPHIHTQGLTKPIGRFAIPHRGTSIVTPEYIRQLMDEEGI